MVECKYFFLLFFLVGRRDSCTMTAEVLSSLAKMHSENNHGDCALDQLQNDLSGNDKSLSHQLNVVEDFPISTIMGPPSLPGALMHFASTTSRSSTYLMSNLSHLSSNRPPDVGDKIGISMSPNDYRLLTDPRLINYVTDQETESQLIE